MSKKAARDPNAPKRNQSAYLLYQNAMRDTFKLQNPGMTFGQLAKYTSAMYAEMPPEEKEAWAQRAEQDKARYLHELSQYVPPPGYDVKGDAVAGAGPTVRALKNGKTRDPNAPKKNMSAYLMYQNTMRESFRTENPGMTFGQLSKFTSAMYKSLTPEEKGRWEEAALQDKARYETEMANYTPPPGFDPNGNLLEANGMPGSRKYSKKNKDPNAPKRARGSYVFFTLDERPKIVKETPEMKFTEMGHVMGERWRALSAEDKKKYEDLANDDKKRFNEEMAAYNAQKLAAQPEPAPAPAYTHPQYQEAQQYAEQYYAQHDAANAAAAAAHYDPNAAAYAQYYAQHGQAYPPQVGYPPQQGESPTEYHYA
mmetsp:Transcript_19900/g.41881  ORF Transcript_19900/g.41881 Transcript_19900/m.41881 type:complete len:368 (-) Transcript_19900:188-1291(-)|eukprot:CAMPEP_0183703352 /NCGR_PEP_ID=MMETSP0737-20130205/1121_1 /TAXON_ID=385413 /ORGANISM="Thalassiosira miniscula, Strain CCMP1093" /LENGTH=367 /DNA_ID=CAMNT_0025930083 /DNA_START=84 /DNA_END=1187 /DNA_ORIENTATION=-